MDNQSSDYPYNYDGLLPATATRSHCVRLCAPLRALSLITDCWSTTKCNKQRATRSRAFLTDSYSFILAHKGPNVKCITFSMKREQSQKQELLGHGHSLHIDDSIKDDVAHGSHLLDSLHLRVDHACTMDEMVYDRLLSDFEPLLSCWLG